MRRLPICALVLLLGGAAHGAPLGFADRGSAESALSALYVDPFAEEPFSVLQRIYPRGARLESLIRQCKADSALRPADAAEQIVLARLLLEQGRRAEGVVALDRVAKATTAPSTLLRIGKLLETNGERKLAILSYQRASADPSGATRRAALLRLGPLLLAEHRTADALTTYGEARRLAPRDVMMRQQIAEQLAAAHEQQAAVDELRAIEPLVAREPQAIVSLLRRRAELHRRMGHQALEADALILAFVKAPSTPATTRLELVTALLRSFQADPASSRDARARGVERLLAACKRAEASDPIAGLLTAEVHVAGSDKAAGLDTFRRAAKEKATEAYALHRLATLAEGSERVTALRRLFALEPNDAVLGLQLVEALLTTGAADAMPTANVLKERFINNPTVLDELGKQLRRHGRLKEGLAVAEQVVAADPSNDAAYITYADALIAVGRQADAARALRHAVDREPSPAHYRQLIEALDARHLDADVRKTYDELLTVNPSKPVRRDYAVWLSAKGDLAAAIQSWNTLLADRTTDPFLRDFATHELARLERTRTLGR